MADSALQVEIVPVRPEEIQRVFGPLIWLLGEIILELRGYTKGEIDGWMGYGPAGPDRFDNPGAGALGGKEFFQGTGGER